MSTSNLDANDLAAALAGGLIREDVVNQIYNLDEGIPTRFTDLVGSDSFSNVYSEWTENDLAPIALANAVVDGADAAGNDTRIGKRVGNRAQLSDKVVQISSIAEEVDSIGSVGRMAYQTARRLMELRREVEATALGRQASVVDDGASVAGKTASLRSFLTSNTDVGTGGANGGFDTGTKLVDAPTAGNARALTWTQVRDQIENVYSKGGNPSVLMSVPGVIKQINSFLFSDAGKPFRAEPTANIQGATPARQSAQGYISVVLSDFGVELSLVDNRLQLVYDSADATPVDVADTFLIDPAHAALSFLYGYRVDSLAKQGHNERKMISTSWMTKVFREDAHAAISDIDPTQAVTA